MDRWIVNLDSPRALKESCAGGKGASLARLRKDGFNVPPGFVITPRAFTGFLTSFQIEAVAQKHAWSGSELRLIAAFIRDTPMPARLAGRISRAYRKHHNGSPVAVRSSMIGEDREATSFAGQLDTVLNVSGEAELLAAVQRCWASLFNERLLDYLFEREQTAMTTILTSFAIAVVVQRMAPARAAGVAFSADPITGERCTVIEAVEGLGDALVAGRVEPDRYVLDSQGVSRAITLAGRRRVLPEATAAALSQHVQGLARRRGTAQDVEWAWDGGESEEGLYLLQSRPITSLAGKRVYTNSMVAEMLPGLIKPLVWSVSAENKLKHVLGRIFTEIIGPNDLDFTTLAQCIHGRIYADATMLGELLERMGLPPNFFEMMSRDEHAAHRKAPPLNARTLKTMVRIARFVGRYATITDEIETYIQRHTQALVSYRETAWSALSPSALWNEIEALYELYSESLWYNFIGPINMMLRNRLLVHMVHLWAPEVQPNDLVRGLVGLKSLESSCALQALADQAKRLKAESLVHLAESPDPVIRGELMATPAGQAMVQAVDAFLDTYGFLSAAGTDLSRTPWIERPTVIWRSIARTAANANPGPSADGAAVREAARQRVRDRLKWWQRLQFDRVLTSTISYIALRERTSFLVSEDSYYLRRAFLTLADGAVQRDIMRCRDDIFYLYLDEVRRLAAGTLDASAVQDRVAARRKEMEMDAGLDLPDTICEDSMISRTLTPPQHQTYLTGITGSSGVATGRACIILDPALAPSALAQDAILVVPFTDVSWTPLFIGAGGIIAETGGQLSHSAIIAREYGLPAVVNVKNATRLIRDGQSVVVDGNQGRVYLQ